MKSCFIKAWIDTKSHSNISLSSEIANSKDLSIIQQDLISQQHKIFLSLYNLKFYDIENIIMNMQNYIILSIYFSNIVIIFKDASKIRILCLSIEFQVIEQVITDFLIERDILKTYKIIINEELDQIVFSIYSLAFYIFITEISHEEI